MADHSLPGDDYHPSKNKTRRAHHKVKTGCEACKSRRRKCDEQKPTCSGCIRHATVCTYPSLDRSDSSYWILSPSHNRTPVTWTAAQANLTRPQAPPQNLNLDDLELLHQYLTSTCIATSQLPEVTAQIQQKVPELAREYPFYMHGILAQAAVHLSWLRPSQQQHYTLLATKHHGLALPQFRTKLQTINKRNHRALLLYSFSLVWCAFANHAVPFTGDRADQNFETAHLIPEWFSLLRGSCLIIRSCGAWTTNNTYALPRASPPSDFSRTLDHLQLTHLSTKLLPASNSAMCEDVLSALHHAFVLAFMHGHNTPMRNAINFWVGSLPSEFLSLVQREEPWTLVVMAHFCILVYRSETRWFMKGHGVQMLQGLTERLDDEWMSYVSWPCEELGLTPITRKMLSEAS